MWVGDIAYLPRQGSGWLYLAVWLDRCSRKVVGWDVRETMPEDLVSEALRRALPVRRPPADLIVHSDRGSQYRATRFKDLLARHGVQQSMSRRGNCYDNAHDESFWSRFKADRPNPFLACVPAVRTLPWAALLRAVTCLSMVILELLSTLLQLALFALVPFVVFLVQRRSVRGFGRYLGLYAAPARANGWAALASGVLVSSTLGVALASPAIKALLLDPHSVTGRLHQLGVGPESLAVLVLTAVGKTALAEELFFRGFVAKRLMAAWGFAAGNLAQAALFGALHIAIFWTLAPGAALLAFVFVVSAVGAYLAGYLNERLAAGSIMPGWISHALANLISYAVIGFVL